MKQKPPKTPRTKTLRKTRKLIDPRRPIKRFTMPEHERRVFRRLHPDRALQRAVAQLALRYTDNQILDTLRVVRLWSDLRLRMIANFGVVSRDDENHVTVPDANI